MLVIKSLALLAAAVLVTGQSIDSLPTCAVSTLTLNSPYHLTFKRRDLHVQTGQRDCHHFLLFSV